MYDIPVLFIFFNRVDVAKTAFERIRDTKPSKLYLAQDGCRIERGEEEEKNIMKIREMIISMIDWPCDVKTLFRQENVGCGMGVKTAIDWMFENESCGIILEDDCVVHPSFWPYMQALLSLYAHDQRVGMIAGYNPLGQTYSDNSYTFSHYKACWGWATWKRAWDNMDIDMKWRSSKNYDNILHNMSGMGRDKFYWKYRLKAIEEHYVDAWDWQWYFTMSSQNQLCVFPLYNLVCNIGFGNDATHTNILSSSRSVTNGLDFPLRHPSYIVPNAEFDERFYKYNNSIYNRIVQRIPFFVKRWLKTKILK